MNASKVQLAMLVRVLGSALDREVCATGIQVKVENTGINVILVEITWEGMM